MIPPLYTHQKNILAENKLWHGHFTGTGSAKTRTCLELAEGDTLIICPKQQKLDQTWEKNAEKFGINKNLTVMSKEEFRRDWQTVPQYTTVIVDECHTILGVLPETRQRNRKEIPKTSQLFEAALCYLQKYPPKRLYLASATPSSKPMNVWAVAKLLGHNWDFYQFRSAFYFPTLMGRRQIWLPRRDSDTLNRLATAVQKLGYTGGLNDFADVPEQTHKEVYIDLTEPQKKALKQILEDEADPLVRRARQRTIENGVLYGKKIEKISDSEDIMKNETTLFPSGKIGYILERAGEFSKILIFANYTAQVHEIARVLTDEGYKVLTLTGSTKDRGSVVSTAESLDKCIVIAQSSISAGYELPSFPCVIFASKSFQFVHYEQALGRVLRINRLKKNLYIHLIVKDGADHDCHKAIMAGSDFQEKLSVL